jgi:hypothetical protein
MCPLAAEVESKVHVAAQPLSGLVTDCADRRRATTRRFQQRHRRWRPMAERSIARRAHADGCPRVPYRGIQPNQAWWSLRAAAVNLRRLLVLGLARHDNAWVLA